MEEKRVLRVLEDCIGWSTELKKGELRAAGNPTPLPLAKDDVVDVIGPGLAAEPTSLLVQTAAGVKIEVRERFLGPV